MQLPTTYRDGAEQWGKSYSEHERSTRMGHAMQIAQFIYNAVPKGSDLQDEVKWTALQILAGAIADIQQQARDQIRAEVLAEARALVAGAVRIAHNELDRVASDVQSGKHFGV